MKIHIMPSMDKLAKVKYFPNKNKENQALAVYETVEAEVEEIGGYVQRLLLLVLQMADPKSPLYQKLFSAGVTNFDIATAKLYFSTNSKVEKGGFGVTLLDDEGQFIASFPFGLNMEDDRTDFLKPNHHKIQRHR